MSTPVSDQQIAAVRAFNRFYTRRLGVLEQHLYDSPFSLTEARIMYELANGKNMTAAQLSEDLGLDAGQQVRGHGLVDAGILPASARDR